jgi:hypothetical protein
MTFLTHRMEASFRTTNRGSKAFNLNLKDVEMPQIVFRPFYPVCRIDNEF